MSPKSEWVVDEKIEMAIEGLIALDTTEEGKLIAAILKPKYWTDILPPEMVESISF